MIGVEELLTMLPGAVESDATRIEELELGAVAFVHTQTGRYFGPPEVVTEYVTGGGTRRLWLTDRVTSSPAESGSDDDIVVVIEERATAGGDATAVSDFTLRQTDREATLVRLAGAFWTRGYEYAITYWRGYASGDEPADIRQLVLDLVILRWGMRGHEGMKTELIAGYSYTRFGNTDLENISGGPDTVAFWHRPVAA